jgi:hypothetical protein
MTERIALTSDEAREATGIGKATLYAAAKRGNLEVRWVGSQKFVVEPEALQAWVRTLPTVKPKATGGTK